MSVPHLLYDDGTDSGSLLISGTTSGVYLLNLVAGAWVPETYEIRCVRRSPHVSDVAQYIFHTRLQVEFRPGIGNTNAPGNDPLAVLRFSNDGGRTWSSAREAHVGKVGQYLARAQWYRLGRARDRVYEVSWTDPTTRWVITQAFIELEEGTS